MLQDLHHFIHQLSPQEQQWVQLYSQLYSHGKPSNYLRLMQHLLALPQWNEAALAQRLQGEKFAAHARQTGNYLLKLILRCLRHAPVDGKLQVILSLHRQLHHARMLLAHGLLQAGAQRLLALEEELLQSSQPGHLISVTVAMVQAEEAHGPLFGTPTARQRLKRCVLLYKNEMSVQHLSGRITRLLDSRHFSELQPAQQQEVMALLQHPLVSNPAHALCASTRFWQLSLQHRVWDLVDDDKNEQVLLQMIELLQAHPAYARLQPFQLFNCQMALLFVYEHPQRYHRFPALLQQLLQANPQTPYLKAYVRPIQLVHLLNHYSNLGRVEEVRQHLAEARQFIEEFQDQIRPDILNNLFSSAAEAGLKCGLFELAIDFIQYSIQKNGKQFRPDLLSHLRYLQLLAHFLLGHHSLLHSQLRSARHFTDHHSSRQAIDDILLRWFGKLEKKPPRPELKAITQKTLDELLPLTPGFLEKTSSQPFWALVMQAIISGQPLPQQFSQYYEPLLQPPPQ